jgi:hypothetical protein
MKKRPGCPCLVCCRVPGVSHRTDLSDTFFVRPPVIEEGGVKMKLTVIDTPGFGDQINNENWYESALDALPWCALIRA